MCFRVITLKMVRLCFWTLLKRHFSLPQINPSSIHLNSSCFVSNLQLSIDFQAAEGLEIGHCLQPWHEHTDICHPCKQVRRGRPTTATVRQSMVVWVNDSWMKTLTHIWLFSKAREKLLAVCSMPYCYI